MLLPRAQQGVPITKLNIIGERQRFGVQVLAAGLNVVHADADALFLRDPGPLLAEGDIVDVKRNGKCRLPTIHESNWKFHRHY